MPFPNCSLASRPNRNRRLPRDPSFSSHFLNFEGAESGRRDVEAIRLLFRPEHNVAIVPAVGGESKQPREALGKKVGIVCPKGPGNAHPARHGVGDPDRAVGAPVGDPDQIGEADRVKVARVRQIGRASCRERV